jgi:hypothetical protein
MSNARGGPYLVDFVAHNNFDDWSMDVCCYLREPARELFKGLTTSCVIYFEDELVIVAILKMQTNVPRRMPCAPL